MFMSYSVGLDNDVLNIIFMKLYATDLGICAQVCKQWTECADQDSAWQHLQLDGQHDVSNAKERVAKLFKENAFPLFELMSQLPDKLPEHKQQNVLFYSFPETWEKYAKGHFNIRTYKIDVEKLRTGNGYTDLMKAVAKTFNFYLLFEKIGFTKFLDKAENLAKKTADSFRNPYPFLVLKEKYARKGDSDKAAEMKFLAEACKNFSEDEA